MNTIKLVVFDMAGTTVNENNIVYKTVQKVINDLGYQVSLDAVLEFGAGKEKHQAITDVLQNCTHSTAVQEEAATAFAAFKPELEVAYDTQSIGTFEGMLAFFKRLKEDTIKVVLNTGYDSKTATKLLAKLEWHVGEEIDMLITADAVENGRPAPDMIHKAMQQFGITDPSQVLKAGDSQIDIIEGKNAKCGLTIGVLSGAQTKEQLEAAKPDYILKVITELEGILLN
ncbi:phosphonatase-like hydrolase [Leeuwenhoekiella polynyae]|uniref:Phosphonatase-like hydrolase n=1 Tax=Leeuwenhoekiella polynyae TaxID=1550906 RepID=A0A4Q0NSB9_9FLAO|nr:phosphonatase-like hydrolase [Leeuwenhoekiella polynyae]RXG13888.1 phosphonatase-like hydrolase [Leeuwenhoekiella polynyae]